MLVEELDYDEDIPMPDNRLASETGSVNFMGRLAKEIIDLSNAKKCIYFEPLNAFYDLEK